MARYAKISIFRNCVADRGHFVAMEFDELIATFAEQMVVLRVTVIVFVNGTIIEAHFTKQTGIDKFAQRTIDRGPTDFGKALFSASQFGEKIFSIKVFVMAENLLQNGTSLLRNSFAPTSQELFESGHGSHGHFYAVERESIFHAFIVGSISSSGQARAPSIIDRPLPDFIEQT